MTAIVEIKCDQCGWDLTTTGNCEDYRLVLTYESKTPWYIAKGERGGAVTSMAIPPPINKDHHFCGIGCLATWLTEKKPKAPEEYERLQKHRAWLSERLKKDNAAS